VNMSRAFWPENAGTSSTHWRASGCRCYRDPSVLPSQGPRESSAVCFSAHLRLPPLRYLGAVSRPSATSSVRIVRSQSGTTQLSCSSPSYDGYAVWQLQCIYNTQSTVRFATLPIPSCAIANRVMLQPHPFQLHLHLGFRR
jgi:hypothetical protein